jgi:general secretion pathway protein L
MARLLTVLHQGLRGFFAWWFGELAGLVPARLSPARRRDRRRLVLALDHGGISVSEIVGDREQQLGGVIRSGPGQEARIATMVRRARRRTSRITLRLAPGMGLRKALDLPLAAENDLDQLLRFEMDRLTPFRAEDVVFARRVLERDPERQRMRVELQVAPRAVVEQALAVAADCRVRPSRVELARLALPGADSEPDTGPALNLLPAESETAPPSRLNRWLALLALALLAAALAIPLQQQRLSAADLERQVAVAKAAAQQSVQLRDRLDQLDANVRFLSDEKRRVPMLTHVLAELTRVIPDQAYVEQLDVRDGELNLRGLATTPSDLIALLDQSPLFEKPEFRSPVTQDARLGLERFQLSAKVAEAAH